MSYVYLARFAHLKTKPNYKPGDILTRGDIIGTMGNTGKSTGAHLHFDLIQFKSVHEAKKEVSGRVYRLTDLPKYIINLSALMEQYHHFIDAELFGCPVKITTGFGDPLYCLPGWVLHLGFDLVPKYAGHRNIKNNRSSVMTTWDVGFDRGYGNYIVQRVEA